MDGAVVARAVGGGAYKHYASLPASTEGPPRALLILEAKTFITAVHTRVALPREGPAV